MHQFKEKEKKKKEERMKRRQQGFDLQSPSAATAAITPLMNNNATSFTEMTHKYSERKPPLSPTSPRRESSGRGFSSSPDTDGHGLGLDDMISVSVTEEHDPVDNEKKSKKHNRKKSSHGDSVPELSASGSNRPNGAIPTNGKSKDKNIGKLQLIAVDENRGLDDSEKERRRNLKDMGDITKYEPSTGGLDGCYSYISWIQLFMVMYLNIYLSSEKPQLRMMYQRTVFQLFWLLIIGLHGSIPSLRENERRWKTDHHVYVSFSFDNYVVIIIYIIAILFTILAMIFFGLLSIRSKRRRR